MATLQLDGANFSGGRATFEDNLPSVLGRSARVYVKIAVNGLAEPILVLLDTGAEYSVLAREVAEDVGLDTADGQATTIEHRGGSTPGKLIRTTVTMVADEGMSLDVDATVFVPDNGWPPGRSFIGYSGFLSHVRFALDPQNNDIYFGGYDQ